MNESVSDCKNDNCISSGIKSNIESKVQQVCNRVTDIVMKQIDIQLDKLEQSMTQPYEKHS